MNHPQQAEPGEGLSETTPFEVLHLRASAPQKLVVEVYWHLVQQFQEEARDEPELRSRVDQLSEAYATIMTRDGRIADTIDTQPLHAANGDGGSGKAGPSSWLPWRGKGRPGPAAPKRSLWDLLDVDPGAPSEIVELAYSFWRLQLRAQWGESAITRLEQLEEAYEALRQDGAAPSQPRPAEPDLDISPTGPSQVETAPHVDTDAQPDAAEVEVKVKVNDRDIPGAVVRASSRTWRSVAAMSVTFGRWLRRVASPIWRWFVAWLKKRAADPFYEYRPGVPAKPIVRAVVEPPQPELDQAGLEKRLSALAAARVENAALRESSQAPTEPEVTPPIHSEKVLAVQRPQIAGPSEALVHLVAEAESARGVSAVIGLKPLSIGTDPSCDLVLKGASINRKDVAARIWAHEDRFMLHVMAAGPAILVNGEMVTWALLEDGDRLQIGDEVFRFERTVAGADSHAGG